MKKIIYILLLILLTTTTSHSKIIKAVTGRGTFFTKEEDSIKFIKKQLLYNAIKDIYSKTFEQVGLNSDLFWARYNEKFDYYFERIEKKLLKKYKVKNIAELNDGNQEKYRTTLRQKKHTAMARFGNLNSALVSYVKNNITRSVDDSTLAYLNVKAKVDIKKLNRIYYKFTTVPKNRKFQSIYLTTKINLKDSSWEDLGVDASSSLTDVLLDSWKKWIEDNIKGNILEVIVPHEAGVNKLVNYSKSLLAEGKKEVTDFLEEDDVLSIPGFSKYKDSLWLEIVINIQKESENNFQKKRSFKINGEYIISDLRNYNILSHADFSDHIEEYIYKDDHKLSSNLASFIYRVPIQKLKKIKDKLTRVPQRHGKVYLTVFNTKTLKDIFKLQELLTTLGAAYQFQPGLESFNGNKGELIIHFNGKGKEVLKVLRSYNNIKLYDNSKLIINEDEEGKLLATVEYLEDERDQKAQE
jgi:hypothetical protein